MAGKEVNCIGCIAHYCQNGVHGDVCEDILRRHLACYRRCRATP
jgi:hypothetical protein